MKKYLFEGLVIFSSVLLSLYLGNLNQVASNVDKKNAYLKDLIKTLNDDIHQIESLLETLYQSEEKISSLQNDIDQQHQLLEDKGVITQLIDIEVGFSFFPKDGIYNQMISTGAFELINNNDLKNKVSNFELDLEDIGKKIQFNLNYLNSTSVGEIDFVSGSTNYLSNLEFDKEMIYWLSLHLFE